MKTHLKNVFVSLLLLSLLPLISCSKKTPEPSVTSQQEPQQILQIATESLAINNIQPGLAVTYFLQFFKRNLEDLGRMKEGEYEAVKGEPVLQLNHQFGSGEVFNSGASKGVAMRMKGYVFFPKAGVYELQAFSNDGIMVTLTGHLIISDPRQHSDRFSDIAQVKVDSAGWAPTVVEYFQRKGTSSLKLLWKVPGSNNFVPIPKSCYGHNTQ